MHARHLYDRPVSLTNLEILDSFTQTSQFGTSADSSSLLLSICWRQPTSMFVLPMTHISPHLPTEMPQKKLGDSLQPSLYTSASCMDFHQRRDDDGNRQRRSNQHLSPPSQPRTQTGGQQPRSSPLPQTQWTDVPPVYRPRNWVDPNEVSPVATRQSHPSDPMSAWRARPPPSSQAGPSNASRDPDRPKKRRAPRIFRRQDTAESQQQQPFDVTMLYPQMSPYDSNRMSTYSAPEQLEHFPNRTISQPNSPGFAPSWSALPSRSDEPSPVGIPRSPTYPPAGRRRMHSTTGVGDAAFEDEQDFRLFVEATAGLPPDIGFSRAGQSPTQTSQSPIRRAATTQATRSSIVSPIAETPSTMFALQQLASIPQANQTYRPQRAPQSSSRRSPPHETQSSTSTTRPRATRSDSNRERLAASASGLDLWLPSPISPESQTQTIPRRPVGTTTTRAPTFPDVSPITPSTAILQHSTSASASARPPAFRVLDREIERQLEELELGEEEEERDFDDELPDYAQSQAEAQAERRAEAARRAQELQERWLRRGR